jgi:hypothetical protein
VLVAARGLHERAVGALAPVTGGVPLAAGDAAR